MASASTCSSERGVDERDARLGLRQQVGQLVAARVEVDRDVHQAGARAPEEEQQVGVGVLAERRDAVARLEPERDQPGGDAPGGAVEFGVRPAAIGERQREAVRGAARAALQQSADGARIGRHGPRGYRAPEGGRRPGAEGRVFSEPPTAVRPRSRVDRPRLMECLAARRRAAIDGLHRFVSRREPAALLRQPKTPLVWLIAGALSPARIQV